MLKKKYSSTPIQKLTLNLNGNNLYMKRDDLLPFSFGGNKVRKALLFFDEIDNQKYDCVVTYGSISSNHCRIVANLAASRNLKCVIISPSDSSKITFNRKMMELFKAEIVSCEIKEVSKVIKSKLEVLSKQGFKPYFIPGGGHGNLGTKAYIDAYEEIKEYEFTTNTCFDYVFHTSGTGTTQAGLICGSIINQDNKQIIGISNAREKEYGKQIILDSVNNYLLSIKKKKVDTNLINFIDDYILDGYGTYNEEVISTIREVMVIEGIPLDLTYTGKGYWGMKRYIMDNQITGQNILFIHTGGTPVFFDNLEDELNE